VGWSGRARRSHIAVPALDVLADHRCCDLVRDLDVPDFAFALRCEVGEQLWDDRHIAYLVAAQAEATVGRSKVQTAVPTKTFREAPMSRYRRLKIEGGAFFFTLALAGRGSDL
jgi:hypothetical protein